MSIEVNATEQIIEVTSTGSTVDVNVTSQTVDVNATTTVIDVAVTNGPGPGVPDGGLTGQVLKKQSNSDYDTYWATDTAGVPYIGATGDVDLGEHELKAGQVEFDQTPTGTTGVGVLRWNDTDGTLDLGLKGGNVTLQIGQEQVLRVVNKTGADLLESQYRAVRVRLVSEGGAQGQRLAVVLAQGNNDPDSATTIGIVTETILNNQEGFITTSGEVRGIDTTGSLQGETWADGDIIYLSPTTPGAITKVKPTAPDHTVVLGYVVYAHQNNGKLFVKVDNGYELGELHDVNTTGATAGQVLKYNGTIWTPSSDLDTGITSLNGLTALTQTFATGTSGTDFNISSSTSTHTFNLPTASATNRGLVSSSDWSTFNAKIGGTLATGQVAFGSAANTIAGSNNLFWDNTNGRLGIGTNAPTTKLGIISANNGDSVRLEVPATNLTVYDFYLGNSANTTYLRYNPQILEFRRVGAASTIRTVGGILNDLALQADGALTFFTNGANERMRIFNSTGNLLLQNGGTFTDGGQRLQVQGDAFIKGSGNTSGTTALQIQNSDGNNIWRLRNDGVFVIGNHGSQNTLIFPFLTTAGVVDLNARNLQFYNQSTSSIPTNGAFLFSGGSFAPTLSASLFVNISNTFAPTSGTGTIAYLNIGSTINQTGGANGITRGLYVNPTLTAAADWRSIEWSNNTGWGLYGAGTSANYLNGSLGIGTTGVDTTSAYSLRVSRQFTTVATARGIVSDAQITAGPTGVSYFSSSSSASATANVTTLRHFVASQSTFTTGAVVTTQTGFEVTDLMVGATNNYAFKGGINAGTNRWNAFFDGTANNYIAGSLGIGSTSLTGSNLRVSKGITGAINASSINTDSTVQSDVTNIAHGYYTGLSTAATTFTLSNLRHFYAEVSSFGAGSTVTNQIGFGVSSNLTGATNNYGFFGSIPSGTGRWNFYGSGTAANYLNGNTIIGGSAVDGGQKLQVNGDTLMKGSGNTSATTALTVQNSDGTNILRIRNNGDIAALQSLFVGPNISGTNGIVAANPSDGSITVASNTDYSLRFSDLRNSANSGYSFWYTSIQYSNLSYTSGVGGYINVQRGFAPTSGTGVFNAMILQNTINQTGGANGITRGLYINPTLTSAADFRAIEVSAGTTVLAASVAARASLRIPSGTAPTSPVDGDIWFDGTDLKMRIGGVTKTFTLV